MMQVEFTDRYGGRAPSTLRGCFRCDAMGCYPTIPGFDFGSARSIPVDAEWEFVKCGECGGTARVSWFRTVARIPRWLVKGARFVATAHERPGWGGHTLGNYWLHFKCAFLVDLGLWRP